MEDLRFLNQICEDDVLEFKKEKDGVEMFEKAIEHYSAPENWESVPVKDLYAIAWEESDQMNGQMELSQDGSIHGEVDSTRKLLEDTYTQADLRTIAKINRSFFLAKKGENNLRPVSPTGLTSWAYRAGWGNCPNILGVNSKNRGAFPSNKRAEWLTQGSLNSKEIATLYTPDGCVRYVGSDKYVPLPAKEGYDVYKSFLNTEYPNSKYRHGFISHDLFGCDFFLNDEIEEDSFALRLSDLLGEEVKTKFLLRFTTGNTGDSVMKVQLVLQLLFVTSERTKVFPVGKPEEIWHLTSRPHLIKGPHKDANPTFEEKIPRTVEGIKDAEQKVERLGNIRINHLKGTMYHWWITNVSKQAGKAARENAEDFANTNPHTFIDLFLFLMDKTGRIDTGSKPTEIVDWLDKVAKLLWEEDLSRYDKELPPEE